MLRFVVGALGEWVDVACLLLFASPCQNLLQFIVHLCTGQHTCPVLALVLCMRPLVHAAQKCVKQHS